MNEEDACNQTLKDDNIIEFSNETDTKICEDKQWIYKWHVSVNDSNVYDVNVTIISLNLDESAGNYLIISPGKWQWSIHYNTMLELGTVPVKQNLSLATAST